MNQHLRIPSPGKQLAIFLGLFGASFLLFGILSLIVLQVNGVPVISGKMDWSKPGVVSVFKWLQGLSSIVIFLLTAFVFTLITYTGKPFYFLGFKKANQPNMYILAVVALFFALPFVFWMGELNQKIPLPTWMTSMEKDALEQMQAFLKVNNPIDVWVNVFIIAMLPAIGEELCFRSVLQRIMIRLTRSPWAGILVTGFLFSLLHFQFEGFLPRMLLGIILGVLYWYSGSIWTSILAHFFNNALQVLVVSYMPKYVDTNPSIPVLIAVVSLIATLAILYFYRKISTITYSKVYEVDELTPHNEFIA